MAIDYTDLTKKNKRISELSNQSIYLRDNQFFFKLNDTCHVKCILNQGRWVGDGTVEELDPTETVRVIQA